MPKKKNIPMRMCIACKEMKPKADMTRVVKNAEGEISPDPTGKAPGRGAYICSGEECLKKLTLPSIKTPAILPYLTSEKRYIT